MSERSTIQGSNVAVEGNPSLDGLTPVRAPSKDPQSLSEHPRAENDADLTSASIAATDVLRSPHRQGVVVRGPPAKVGAGTTSNLQTLDKRRVNPQKQPQKKTNGVFTNPTYKYNGGFLSKIIAFFANILKAIERLFLRLLNGPDQIITPSNRQNTAPSETKSESTQIRDEKLQRKKRGIISTTAQK
jgi:hypothetical protein